ncbi:MAG: hypothetical protein AAGI01_06980, partial [Myxococcota bacterium]
MNFEGSALDVVCARIGHLHVAIDLASVQSILTRSSVTGVRLLDPSAELGTTLDPDRHVALLAEANGPPMALCVGQIYASERWTSKRLRPLPSWATGHISALLHPACALGEGD